MKDTIRSPRRVTAASMAGVFATGAARLRTGDAIAFLAVATTLPLSFYGQRRRRTNRLSFGRIELTRYDWESIVSDHQRKRVHVRGQPEQASDLFELRTLVCQSGRSFSHFLLKVVLKE